MAARFWVGGTGNWDALTTTHWAATSNGAGGASVPTAADDVTFDASSGTAFTCTVTAAANALSVTFNSASSTLLLNAGLTVVGTVTLTLGALNTNSQTCSFGILLSSNTNTRTLTMGSSAIALTTSVGSQASLNIFPTGLTITANTAVVTISGPSCGVNAGGNFNGTSLILNGQGAQYLSATTFANVTRTGTTATAFDSLSLTGTNATITGNLVVTGANVSPNRLLVTSNSITTPRTLTVGGTVTSTNTDWQDITAAGAGNWTLATATGGVGDCGGNSGFGASAFTTPAVQTCTSSTNVNWSAVAWTSRVPLPQDNAVFTGAINATVTFDVARAGKDIDMSSATGMTLRGGSGLTTAWYGSFYLGDSTNGTVSVSGNAWQVAGRGTHTLSSVGGSNVGPGLTINAGGIYNLTTDWRNSNTFSISQSTLNTNNYNLTIATTLSVSGALSALNAGTSTITVGIASPAGTFTFGAGAIDLSQATLVYGPGIPSTTSRTFAGGGRTIGALTYNTPLSPGPLVITGANTFGTLTVGSGRTLTLPASTTTTVNNLACSGVNNGYLRLPGVAGSYVSTPDSAAVSITGDIDIRCKVALDDWTAINTLLGKLTTGTLQSYRFLVQADGTLLLSLSLSGATYIDVTSSVTNGIADGTTSWVRATWRASDGRVQFFKSSDGISWSQLGTNRTISIASIYDSTTTLCIGQQDTAGAYFATGNFYRAQIRNNVLDDGTGIVFDADFTAKPFGANTFTESSSNAATVTLNGLAQQGDGRLEINSSTSAPNLLTSDQASYENASGWTLNNNCSVSQNASLSLIGSKSLQIASVAAGDTGVYTNPRLSVTSGTQYTATAYGRGITTAQNYYILASFRDAGNVFLSTITGSTVSGSTTGWTKIVCTFVAPTNAANVAIIIHANTSAIGEQHVFDDMTLIAASAPATPAQLALPNGSV